MELDVGCTFVFAVPTATHAIMLVEPHSSELHRVVGSRLDIIPHTPSIPYVDSFANRRRRTTFKAGTVEVSFVARVDASPVADVVDEDARLHEPQDLPDDALRFLLPSRYCESDQLVDLAWAQFASIPPGWARVQAINDWVHARLQFDYGSSSPSHSAASVLEGGVGVCRDFTHLAIGLCRALNIPARYVSGYLPDIDVVPTPPDFCAWMEVFLGDRWYTFDPRNNQRRIGRVVIGRGRDAADVAMFTSFGQMDLIEMNVLAEPVDHQGNTMFIEASRSTRQVCDTL